MKMDNTQNNLQCLPVEMLDIILMKVVGKLVLSTWEENAYELRTNVYAHIATVWSEWHHRLAGRWFNIVLQRKLLRINPFEKYLKKPEEVKTIKIDHSVWGLALLNNELFLASIDAVFLIVYNSVTFERLRNVETVGLSGPRDIASYEPKKCLFIVDIVSDSSIFCINPNGKLLKQWQLPHEPHNLSVTPSGNVLLTCNAKILEYTSDGELVRSLDLQTEPFDMTWHSIIMKSGNFFVCQGWMNSKYHRVLTVSPEGDLLRSHGSFRGSADSSLHNPVYVAVDRDGCLLVADSSNHRIILLSPALASSRCFVSHEQQIIEPYRVLLDEKSGRLYVGTNQGRLHILKVFM